MLLLLLVCSYSLCVCACVCFVCTNLVVSWGDGWPLQALVGAASNVSCALSWLHACVNAYMYVTWRSVHAPSGWCMVAITGRSRGDRGHSTAVWVCDVPTCRLCFSVCRIANSAPLFSLPFPSHCVHSLCNMLLPQLRHHTDDNQPSPTHGAQQEALATCTRHRCYPGGSTAAATLRSRQAC